MWRVLPVMLLLSMGCAQQAEFTIVEVNGLFGGASARMQNENGKAVLYVTSPHGIGSARILLDKGDWPQEILVRLNYSGKKPFIKCESFRAELEAPDSPIHPTYPLTPIRFKSNKVLIELPPPFITKEFTHLYINWIDAYRR